MSLELGKREEAVEALASALVQKDTELARMAEELGKLQSRGGWEAVDSSGDLRVEKGTSPANLPALPGARVADDLANEVERLQVCRGWRSWNDPITGLHVLHCCRVARALGK